MLEEIEGGVQCRHLGGLGPDEGGEVDEPQAVAVAQQTLGPHVRHRTVLLGLLLGQLDLLEGGRNNTTLASAAVWTV